MKFSVIIPSFNEEKYLGKCLESVLNQEVDFEYEIIVVDNNSTDKTAEIAQSYGVKVIKEVRPGVGWARYTGTKEAIGEYILQLDADTILPTDYFQDVLKNFQKHKNLSCLSGQMLFYDAPWWKDVLRFIFHRLILWLVVLFSFGKMGAMGNNMCFKKSVYDKSGGFNPNLKFGEDMDLSKKLSKFGKVKLDMHLKCFASARRFKIDKQLFEYTINTFVMAFTGVPHQNVLEKVE